MSIAKILIIPGATAIVLTILLIIYIINPFGSSNPLVVKDISGHNKLKSFLAKSITLQSSISIYRNRIGGYRFHEYVMSRGGQPGQKMVDLPIGTTITIKSFKTYESTIGAGGTSLYALGEYTISEGGTINFEYYWGDTDASLYDNKVPDLPLAPWQDGTASRINVKD